MKFIISTIIFFSLVLNNFAFGEIPQSSEIIAYYPFSGNANDSSGNEYDGTISGDPQLTTDRFGNSNSAYIFDGSGDWIYFGTDTLPENNEGDVSDPFTISVWAKSSSSSTMSLFAYGGMVSCGGGRYGAVVRLGTNIQFNSCNNGFNTSASGNNSDGNWHQYVFTWNGSNSRKVYIDGSLVNSNSTSNVFRIQNTGLVLGRQFMDWAEGTTFTGSADELRLWSTELSSAEVETLYNTESNASPTLSSSVPADNATGIALDSTIVLNFSENVDAESGNITIKKTSDNSTVETIDVTSGQVTGSGTSQITVTPSSDFDSATEYYVLIDATAFDDSDSGSYAGISSTTALSFTIDSLTDPTSDKDITGTIDVQNTLAKNTITEFTSTVNDRLRYLRLNRINDDFSKNNIKFDFGNAMFSSLAGAIPASNISVPDLIPKNWSVWSEGSVSITTIGDNNNSSSKDIDTHGLAFGIDTKLNNNDLLGFALQFNHSDTDVGTNGTGIDSKNYNLSVYRTRPLNDDNFIEGLLSIGSIDSDLVRKSGANTLTGSRDGNQIFGSLNYGKTFSKKDFSLTPIGRIDLGYTELDSYTERGTDALTYDKQVVESGLASIGLAINDIIEFSNSSLKPFGLMKYGLDFSNSSDTKMNYVSDTSTIYTYTQGINSTHLLTAQAGFNYERTDSLKLSGSYKRIQGNESEKTDTIKFGFNYKSQRAAEYAINLDNDKASLSYKKDLNGFDIRMSSNYSLMSQIPDYGAAIEVVNTF